MALRAVDFDLWGVLELHVIELVDHGLDTHWEACLQAGELEHRMKPFWRAGSVGACTEEEVHQGMRERLGMSQKQVEGYMSNMWDWYCGRLNIQALHRHHPTKLSFTIRRILATASAPAPSAQQQVCLWLTCRCADVILLSS
ncbi:hypothetical protein KSC_071960 [Ktedonobacter sp. SOSP1-52]|uniref:hypothetical protein n=1 Tax=Ktedonobacter sp. SOSP1-52 TaxID=2778366 RepID=UPI0019157B29|nr:hypothetical protein [Ktedonobacter sp. SOSP1-52]GHO68304.1 hypothetical protein KSC_071960 [Ktedonobacter sp. SOSP1-52]